LLELQDREQSPDISPWFLTMNPLKPGAFTEHDVTQPAQQPIIRGCLVDDELKPRPVGPSAMRHEFGQLIHSLTSPANVIPLSPAFAFGLPPRQGYGEVSP
jgi:hypothetical protein